MDVQIKITGIPITPTGCTITYATGTIPVATVEFDPSRSDLIAHVEELRRTPVSIQITTTRGNLKFDGFFDGLSFSQSPGGFGYQAIIKNNFQSLQYIYPKLLGVHPGSIAFERVDGTLLSKSGDPKFTRWGNVQTGNDNIVTFYLKMIIDFIESQSDVTVNFPQLADQVKLLQLLTNPDYKKTLTKGLALLNQVDSSAVKNLSFQAQDPMALELITRLVEDNSDTLWNTLVNGLNGMGCTVAVANSKLFVVPENTFLSMPHTVPTFKQTSKIANTIYPAQFNSVVFNDNGFRDIGHCILVADASFQDSHLESGQFEFGAFTDTAAGGAGVLIAELPALVSLSLSGAILINGSKLSQGVTSGTGNIPKASDAKLTSGELSADKTAADDSATKETEDLRHRFDTLAKIKYLQAKYGDRTGSITSEFNPNWCPATSGTLFTRYPSINVDFFVEAVTHTFKVAPPNSGTALTNISFSAGRAGQDPAGVTSDEFYNFSISDMQGIQKAFISNIVA